MPSRTLIGWVQKPPISPWMCQPVAGWLPSSAPTSYMRSPMMTERRSARRVVVEASGDRARSPSEAAAGTADAVTLRGTARAVATAPASSRNLDIGVLLDRSTPRSLYLGKVRRHTRSKARNWFDLKSPIWLTTDSTRFCMGAVIRNGIIIKSAPATALHRPPADVDG